MSKIVKKIIGKIYDLSKIKIAKAIRYNKVINRVIINIIYVKILRTLFIISTPK
jgi:hypothetical protein